MASMFGGAPSLSSLREKWAGYVLNFPEQVAAFEKQNGSVPEKVEALQCSDGDDEAADYLEDAIKKLRQGIASANSSKELGGTAIALGIVLQALGGQFGLMLDGPKANMSEQVAANEEAYSNLVKECLCKYGGTALLEPEARLCLLTLACVGGTHARNAAAARLRAADSAGMPPAEPQTAPPKQTPPAHRPDNVAPPPANIATNLGAKLDDDD